MSAGGAEREADEIMDAVCDGRIPTRAELKKKVHELLAACANEARLEALEQAAASIEKLHQGAEDYYTFEIGHVRADGEAAIRALKAAHAPLDPPGGQHEN